MNEAMRAQLNLVAAKWKGRRFDDTPFRHTAIQDEGDPLEHVAPDDWNPPAQLAAGRFAVERHIDDREQERWA